MLKAADIDNVASPPVGERLQISREVIPMVVGFVVYTVLLAKDCTVEATHVPMS